MDNKLDNNNLKKTPFGVPDAYFDKLHQALLLTADEPELNIPEKTAFSVPDQYFKNLNQRVLDNNKSTFKLSGWIYGSVASIALIVALSIGGLDSNEPMENHAASIPLVSETDMLITYLESNYIEDINTEDLEMLVDLDEIEGEVGFELFLEEEFTMEELLEAL